jgi:hypothetical protein
MAWPTWTQVGGLTIVLALLTIYMLASSLL